MKRCLGPRAAGVGSKSSQCGPQPPPVSTLGAELSIQSTFALLVALTLSHEPSYSPHSRQVAGGSSLSSGPP